MKYLNQIALPLVATILLLSPINIKADGDVGLIDLMRNFQYFTHKVGLSIRGGNAELADFYMHEIEENLAQVAKIDEYDGHPVGELSVGMLTPVVEGVGTQLDNNDLDGALQAYTGLINACNACHLVTEHGFIKVVDNSEMNPYMQTFE